MDGAGTTVPTPDDALGLAAEVFAEAPPAALRARVFAAATTHLRPRVAPAGPVEVLAATVADVGQLLDSLTPGEWRAPGALGALDVKRTVAHLHGADHYLGVSLGAWEGTLPADEADHAATSRAHVEHAAGMTPVEVRDVWREWSDRLVAHLRALPPERLGEPARYNVVEGPLGAVLVARAFELWTHAEDICRATGRPPRPPRPDVLAAMTDVASVLVPVGYQQVHGGTAATVRLVLTGAGGGTWDLALGAGAPAEPSAVVVGNVVDFCRVVAARIAPGDLDCEIEGDEDLARRVLVGATRFAMD